MSDVTYIAISRDDVIALAVVDLGVDALGDVWESGFGGLGDVELEPSFAKTADSICPVVFAVGDGFGVDPALVFGEKEPCPAPGADAFAEVNLAA